jgi:hypothetical protein
VLNVDSFSDLSCLFSTDVLVLMLSVTPSGEKNLDPSALYIKAIQANRAPHQRRRTHRAHGRIGAYQASPVHLEVILEENAQLVPKTAEPEQQFVLVISTDR